jgi:hypothetical protein
VRNQNTGVVNNINSDHHSKQARFGVKLGEKHLHGEIRGHERNLYDN